MLILPIKKKWYDMILSGEKKEEYREIKPYYRSRLHNEGFLDQYGLPDLWQDWVLFRNGYSKKSPSFKALCTIDIRTGRPEWGAEPGKEYYVLKILEIKKMREYVDFMLTEQYPNKYNLTIKSIKNLIIADWERLKEKTWYNEAMKKTGSWWCHLEGCNKDGQPYDDEDEFWIGFREDDNRVDCYFTSFGGMCGYMFEKFYSAKEIENEYDMQVQVNAIRWLNSMIDDGILALPE